MRRLAVLGGSSPFTLAFVDRLREASPSLPPLRLVLHGRNTEALGLIAGYARRRLGELGWEVEHGVDMDRVLDGADWVLHQIRYGGMSGRGRDEALAGMCGLAADETLGPAALARSLAIREPMEALSARLLRRCPDAWVLNLTNPLSVATSLLVRGGVSRCIGLCELPLSTALDAATYAGLQPDALEWSYAGLNHRGFIVRLGAGEGKGHRDGIAEIGRQVGRKLGGFDTCLIAELGAIPTKYFSLITRTGELPPPRAAFLGELRDTIFRELREDPERSPPALERRDVSWYDLAVIPVLRSLSGAGPGEHVLNLVGSDGIAREGNVRLSPDGAEFLPVPSVSAAVTEWIERYTQHERALLEAVSNPSPKTVRDAVEADPVVPQSDAPRVAAAVWENRRLEAAHVGGRPG